MMHEELILNALQEIKDNQRALYNEFMTLSASYSELKMELALQRNGFSPHEIVAILHWAADEKAKMETQGDNIRRALVSWIVPIVCSALVIGLVFMFK